MNTFVWISCPVCVWIEATSFKKKRENCIQDFCSRFCSQWENTRHNTQVWFGILHEHKQSISLFCFGIRENITKKKEEISYFGDVMLLKEVDKEKQSCKCLKILKLEADMVMKSYLCYVHHPLANKILD